MTTAMPTEPPDRSPLRPARFVLAAALIVGAVLFVIGTRGESHATEQDASATTTSTIASTTTVPTTEASVLPSVSTTEPASSSTTRPPEGSPEREAQEHGATTVPTTSPPPTSNPAASAPAPTTSAPAAAEGTPEREAAEGAPGHVETAAEQSSEKILGVNLESGGIVASVVIASIALAALVLYRRFRAVLWVGAAFCAFAAAADLHEVRIQIDRSKTGLVLIAATVAAVHATGAVAGLIAARQRA